MTIFVSDYTSPSAPDCAEGIRRAIADAKRLGASELHFGAGTYPLISSVDIVTDQSAHDAGAKLTATKAVLLLFEGFRNFTISGEVDENGEPATVLAGTNTLELHSIQPSILWCDNCPNLTVKNLAFTRAPEFASAGRVESLDGGKMTVRVLDGCPCYDGMGTHCMNRFTPDRQMIYESLSYGPGLGTTFRLVGDRLLSVESEKLAGKVKVGDLVTWHQGAQTDFQVYFGRIENLRLSNLRTYNSNGFAMIAFECHDIKADRVVFKPRGNQLFTAPRDAWKLHKCSGHIEISRFYVEGVRMDGQNVHNNYMFVIKKLGDSSMLVAAENARNDFRTSGGLDGRIGFYVDEKCVGKLTLKSYEHLSTTVENGKTMQHYRFDFNEPIDFGCEGGLALADCFMPDFYHCHDSEFYNVAGAGHLLRISHVLIENCRYKNMMNAGIMLGAEFPTHHEGGNCEDVKIQNCEFDNCGFSPRYGTVGCIGVNSSGFRTPVNHNIRIENCIFRNSGVGVDLHLAFDVRISNCRYENLTEDVRLS